MLIYVFEKALLLTKINITNLYVKYLYGNFCLYVFDVCRLNAMMYLLSLGCIYLFYSVLMAY